MIICIDTENTEMSLINSTLILIKKLKKIRITGYFLNMVNYTIVIKSAFT